MFMSLEMVDMFPNHEENTMLISLEMVDLGFENMKKTNLDSSTKLVIEKELE